MPKPPKRACPDRCARNIAEAIRKLKLYTPNGSCDVFDLTEQTFQPQRLDIMQAYCGRPVPAPACSPAAMLETFAEHARELGTEIDSARQLAAWARNYGATPAESVPADDPGVEAASESPEPAASSGERTMTAATANKRANPRFGKTKGSVPTSTRKAATKKPAKKPAAKTAEPAEKPRGGGKQWNGYQGWELIRGLKKAGVEIDGVKTILEGVGLKLSPGFVGTVYRRRADAGATSGRQPTKLAAEHLAELKRGYPAAFA